MSLFASLLLIVLAAPALLSCLYLLLLTALSASPRPPQLRPGSERLRFDIVVPAHNEAAVIQRAVRSLLGLDWPTDSFRVLVVADNCTDATAALATAEGARVWTRNSAERRGKGYALEFAFRASQTEGWADAVAVIDADSEVSGNLLTAFAARIAEGEEAVQAHYGVLNPGHSWRTRLMTVAMSAFHDLRSNARERLKVSAGIRGNGWCVTHGLLSKVPYQAFSLTEDLEYGIDLGLSGSRVSYAAEAHVEADMVSGAEAAGTQRQRWEKGRMQLIRTRLWPLLTAAFRRRSTVCLDLACDLLVLPLSYVALNVVTLGVVAVLLALLNPAYLPWFYLALICCVSLVAYVLRGWQLSGIGAIGLLDLLRAPFFVGWKVVLMLRSQKPGEWIRTEREKP